MSGHLFMGWCTGIQGQSLISPMGVRHMIILSCFVILAAQRRIIQAVEYEVINNVGNSSAGGVRFTNDVGIQYSRETMEAATEFIWEVFLQSTPAKRKTVEKVSLIIDNRSGYVTSNEIHIWADQIASYSGDVKREFAGTVYHGMTHIWQWNGNGQAPGGLIEGIADFVRLKANYAASFWVQPGEGDRWDQGYSVTAWFLDYCNSLRDGFVAELNKKIRSEYSPDFFVELLGQTVDQLWADYKAKYKSYSTPCENQVIWIF